MKVMARIAAVALLLVVLGPRSNAQVGSTGNVSAGGADCTTANACVAYDIPSQTASIGIQVSGTFSGTLNFEATLDGSSWFAVSAVFLSTYATATSTSSGGGYAVQNTGFGGFRVRGGAGWSSGSARIAMSRGYASARAGAGGGGASYTNLTQPDNATLVQALGTTAQTFNIRGANIDASNYSQLSLGQFDGVGSFFITANKTGSPIIPLLYIDAPQGVRLRTSGSDNLRTASTGVEIFAQAAMKRLRLWQNATYTTSPADDSSAGSVTLCDATSGSINIPLNVVTSSDYSGTIYVFKKIDASANTCTITANASDNIDGAATYVLTARYQGVTIVNTGSTTKWMIVSKFP